MPARARPGDGEGTGEAGQGTGEAGQGTGEAGQGTVELAIVLPVVVLAMLAVVQVGLIGRDQLLVWHAAREAARAAAVDPSESVARSAALRAASSLEPDRLSVSTSGGVSVGELLTASVRYRAPTEVPLVGRLFDDVEMSAEVTMRVE